MVNEDMVYITGHRHPDTDSIAASVAYAFYKRATGTKAMAVRIGNINNETDYLLKRFHIEAPPLLRDARKTLGEIELDPPEYITPETTVRSAVQKMHDTGRNSFAVLDADMKVIGYVSKSDLANMALGDTAEEIDLLRQTPVSDIADAIDGEVLYDDPEVHINGKVSIVAQTAAGIDHYEISDRIVIMGDDWQAQEALIRKGAGVLITVWTEKLDERVLTAAKECHCPVIRSGHGSMNTSRYLFLAPPVKLVMRKKPVMFKSKEFVETAGQQMMKTRYRSYPVIDEEGKLIGYVARFHVLNHKMRKLILVDHNEFSQSIHEVEKAQILEVVDHHRINDFKTTQPVSFRNEIVGSTATMIATIFRENQIPMPQNIAGLLLGAVLSDTLNFQSPTTTQKDRDTANILAALADVDLEQFAEEMFSATASAENRSMRDLIVQDIKLFEFGDVHTMISQVIISHISEIRGREIEINATLESLVEKKDLDLLVCAFTSVLENGSVFYAAGPKSTVLAEAFPDKEGEMHTFHEGVVSRKGQILPAITKVIQEN